MRWLLAVLCFKAALALRQPYDYLVALNTFQWGFLHPEVIVALGPDSPAFAQDIIGRVDVTTTFEGIQLNTEYIYALWLGITENNSTTQIIGSAQSLDVQTLVIEPPMVFTSVIMHLYYASINYTLPVQVDFILNFNDDLKIVSYDATFRRWAEAYYYLIPKLAPQIAKELNTTYVPGKSNDTALVAQRAATDVCAVAMEHCVGANVQYSSNEECMTFLTKEIPFGNPWEGGLNTGWCRYIHKNMVPSRPDVHCDHVGPSGGDMCIDRDYVDIVTKFPFASTLVGYEARVKTADVASLSAASLQGLVQSEFRTIVSTTIAFYPIPVIALFAILYLSARVISVALARYTAAYSTLGVNGQRKAVAYTVNLIYTTLALGLQLPSVVTYAGVYNFTAIQCLKCSAVVISTLFAIFALFISLENTNHPASIPTGSIWLWQATSEQPTFLGMLMHRLKFEPARVKRVLRFAAIQSFIFKFGFFVYLLVQWGMKLAKWEAVPTDVFFSVSVCVVGTLLMATQIYGSWTLWTIASSVGNEPIVPLLAIDGRQGQGTEESETKTGF
ncbi:hypothetical protein MNV49_005372 [Pseudohyphozyma bogoriensis]|nr:hypothetical protein MNV49_005372 [Pseudohyphozyma bogoriensis]